MWEENCIRGDEGLSLTAPTDHNHFLSFCFCHFLFLSILCFMLEIVSYFVSPHNLPTDFYTLHLASLHSKDDNWQAISDFANKPVDQMYTRQLIAISV